MIEDISRCVMQRVSFTGQRTFTRHGPGEHAEAVVQSESVTSHGVYQAANRLNIKPGEVVAVWDLPPDADQEEHLIERNLPPVPTVLLVRAADKQLLELNPMYLMIHDRPAEYR